MLIINDKLISLDLFDEFFMCHLDKCKGSCCIKGDFGAPLEEEETRILDEIFEQLKPFLSEEGTQIASEDTSVYYQELEGMGTPLMKNGACAYVLINENGMAQCAIEKAYNEGAIDFRKPISCHLYPIRVISNPGKNFEALNYDRWDICRAACSKGREMGTTVFEFAKDALVRKYGSDFYEALEDAYDHYKKN